MNHSLSRRLAILIDAENVAASCWPAAAIAARFGTPVLTRAYVCHPPSAAWRCAAGVDIIDGRPADGPNAADFLMAMDAAAIATEGLVDGFILMTADDGFAAAAHPSGHFGRWMEHHPLLALARCDADQNGWVLLGDLGVELSGPRVVMPKGKLSEVVRIARGIEIQGTKSAIRVRRAGPVS